MAAAWVVAARIGVWKTIKPINTDHGAVETFFRHIAQTVCIQAIRLRKIADWS